MSVRTRTVGPVAVLEDADDAVAADLLRHLEASLAQLLGHSGGGFLFLVRKLGVRVQVLIEGVEVVKVRRYLFINRFHAGLERRVGPARLVRARCKNEAGETAEQQHAGTKSPKKRDATVHVSSS